MKYTKVSTKKALKRAMVTKNCKVENSTLVSGAETPCVMKIWPCASKPMAQGMLEHMRKTKSTAMVQRSAKTGQPCTRATGAKTFPMIKLARQSSMKMMVLATKDPSKLENVMAVEVFCTMPMVVFGMRDGGGMMKWMTRWELFTELRTEAPIKVHSWQISNTGWESTRIDMEMRRNESTIMVNMSLKSETNSRLQF